MGWCSRPDYNALHFLPTPRTLNELAAARLAPYGPPARFDAMPRPSRDGACASPRCPPIGGASATAAAGADALARDASEAVGLAAYASARNGGGTALPLIPGAATADMLPPLGRNALPLRRRDIEPARNYGKPHASHL